MRSSASVGSANRLGKKHSRVDRQFAQQIAPYLSATWTWVCFLPTSPFKTQHSTERTVSNEVFRLVIGVVRRDLLSRLEKTQPFVSPVVMALDRASFSCLTHSCGRACFLKRQRTVEFVKAK